jgi:hypothetical protein
VMVHTEPRYTKDLNIWIEPVRSNAWKLFVALAAFGAPTNDIDPIVFTEPEVFFQIGMEPPHRHHDFCPRARLCSDLGTQNDR